MRPGHQQCRHYSLRERPTVVPAGLSRSGKRLMNEEIPAETVNYVDAAGVFHEGARTRQILEQLDRSRYNLVCMSSDPLADVVVCRVSAKDEMAAHNKQRYQQDKAKRKEKKEKAASNTLKAVEISWAISDHDLGHRLRRIRDFFNKAYKVEITIGVKKGMAKQLLTDMHELLACVRDECELCAREVAEPEGAVGRRYVMVFQGIKGRAAEVVAARELAEQQALAEQEALAKQEALAGRAEGGDALAGGGGHALAEGDALADDGEHALADGGGHALAEGGALAEAEPKRPGEQPKGERV